MGRGDSKRTIALAAIAIVWLAATAYFLLEGRWLVGLVIGLGGPAAYLAVRLPKERYVLFALFTVVLSTGATLLFVAGLDLYLHARYRDRGGYNVWGYRGSAVGSKRPAERRLVMLGGSTAFGYGVNVNETIPAYLERDLTRASSASQPSTVVNLGWNGQGAHSFRFTLEAYEYLQYDAAILYSGYNDLGFNSLSFREDSAVFRLTGYLPILPVVPVRDWLHIRDLSATKGDPRVVFNPNLADRYAAEAADTALRISRELERQLGRLTSDVKPGEAGDTAVCGAHWQHYCQAILDAVTFASHAGKTVYVVTEPYISDTHVLQQSAIARMLQARFPQDPLVRYVNLGRVLSLKDRQVCYDGMHLTPEGNERVAAALAAAVEGAGQ